MLIVSWYLIICPYSMLHVLDGSWKPNDEDKKNKLTPGKKQLIQANKLREHMSLVCRDD